jgi:hypothetical protein
VGDWLRGVALPEIPGADRLADRRYLTLIVRLTLDSSGRLLYGELVEAGSEEGSRFASWRGFSRAVRAWTLDEDTESEANDVASPRQEAT